MSGPAATCFYKIFHPAFVLFINENGFIITILTVVIYEIESINIYGFGLGYVRNAIVIFKDCFILITVFIFFYHNAGIF